MMIQGSKLTPYQLPLARNWVSHQGCLEQRSGWLIQLAAGGHKGIGDCAPLASAGTETIEEAEAWLQQHINLLNHQDVRQLLESLDTLKPPPAARCGVETALIDLLAKQAGRSIARWLNADASCKIEVNANLGKLDNKVAQRLNEARGYRVIKLKLGMAPIEQELAWLQQLTAALPGGIRLRLDANRAWPMAQAAEFIAAIASLPIESIEEPLQDPTIELLSQLQLGTTIPLALDESLTQLNMQAIVQQPPVKRITLKPMVMGGLLPSIALA
ncbi:MAG: o-succinylbenzoate synthase, partial [Gammaproteobacteria bacterium]|nr:o-succinylbenzoate synthase [Gammaproteobacteria bacterium]